MTERIVDYAIGFLISFVFAFGFVWVSRHLIGWGDESIIVGLVTMYCVAGGREFSKRTSS